MGQELESSQRHESFRPYRVTKALMNEARPDVFFMHCLPAHRGEEVDAAVIDGPNSAVFDQAENRLHTQKSALIDDARKPLITHGPGFHVRVLPNLRRLVPLSPREPDDNSPGASEFLGR